MGTKGETDRAEVLPGTIYMLVLQTLATRGSLHGYGIALHIRQTTDSVLTVEEGALYPALQRMLLKGWVTAEWRQSENNRRARFYSLTPEGREQLHQEIDSFERTVRAIVQVIRPVSAEV